MTDSGYLARQSHAHQGFAKEMSSTGVDFRGLTPLVVMSALTQAGTAACEPIHRFRLEAPAETLGPLLSAIARLHAIPQARRHGVPGARWRATFRQPALHELRLELPALTRGEGVLECSFDRYERVSGTIPTRARSDDNPLDRHEYLKRLERRAAVARLSGGRRGNECARLPRTSSSMRTFPRSSSSLGGASGHDADGRDLRSADDFAGSRRSWIEKPGPQFEEHAHRRTFRRGFLDVSPAGLDRCRAREVRK
jgi:elongation factor G-like protein